jgi:hypothetical protein
VKLRRGVIEEELSMRETEALRHDGHRAAAWLVRKHRRQLHRSGEMVFTIEFGQATPPWFRIAVEYLKRREGWSAVITAQAGQRTYRVVWLAKSRYSKKQSEAVAWLKN